MIKRAKQENPLVFVLVLSGCVALLSATSCGESSRVELGPDFECNERPNDPTGYLEPICHYLVEHFESYPINPNKLEVKQIIPGDEQNFFGLPEYSTDEYNFVRLSCCNAGDWAIVQVASKEVDFFLPGDE